MPVEPASHAVRRRHSLLSRTLLFAALGLSATIALATWLNYRQVADGLRAQSLKQMELYVQERAARESELFQLAEEELLAFSTAWNQSTGTPREATVDERFESLFEQHPDGSLRLRETSFNRYGISGVIRPHVELSLELKQKLLSGCDLLLQFGPVMHRRFANLYLSISDVAVLMYWPENRWGLEVAPWEMNLKLARQEELASSKSQQSAGWSNLYYDYGAAEWLVSANVGLTDTGQDRAGVDIPLNTLFERTAGERLEGTYNMIIHKNGDLISHPRYMDAILASGGSLSLEKVKDPDLQELYTRVKQYWREAVIIDHPQKHEFLAVSRLSGPSWYLIIVFPYQLIDAQAAATSRKTLGLFGIALLVGLGLLYLVLRSLVAKPLRSLVGATEQLAEGDLSTRVAVANADEMGELGNAFNSMAARLEDALVSRDHLREAQEELRESEQRFADLVEYSPDAILILDAVSGKFVHANDNCVRLFGYEREELMKMGPIDMCPKYQPDGRDSKTAAEETTRTVLSGQQVNMEWLHLTATGKPVYSEVHLARLPSRNRRLIRGNVRDITERHQMEQALKQSEQRFSLLFQHAPAAVTLLDLDQHRWIDVNENTERLYGYSREELLRMHPADVSPEYQPDGQLSSEAAKEKLQQAMEGGTPVFEWEHVRKNGDRIMCEVRLVRYPSEDRRLVQGSIVDISQRKEGEKSLKQARDDAETANRAKSSFLANMSHEFRTPLNAILGFTRLTLGDTAITSEQRENLTMVQQSGEHLLELINDVLEMSKVEAGRTELQETVFDLHELLDTLERMIRLRAEDKGLRVAFQISQNVPDIVKTDQRKLRQILLNLLGNAVKFTHQGAIELSVNSVEREKQQLTLQFQIKDTGVGLSQQEAERLFQPFVQATANTGDQEGTGLGLAISKQFVELMGGKIDVESTPGEGATFHFFIQAELASADELEKPAVKRRVIGLEPGQTATRMLIIEDKVENRKLLRCVLESAGLEVREAENGEVGIEQFEQWSPHLIWMDMRMPVMDGYEATRKIKASEQGQDTTIIALTASAFEEQRSLILDAGCDDLVRKPFQTHEIFDTLARHLGLRFIYEDEKAGTEIHAAIALRAKDLTLLESTDLDDLRRAAASADSEFMADVIHRIEADMPDIAAGLKNMADEFRYDRILTLCGENHDNQ